jgi:hypothetical protein
MTRYFKILVNGASCNGGNAKWNLPSQKEDSSWVAGDWMPAIDKIELCTRGYHVCEARDILHWIKQDCQIFEAENAGASIEGDNKTVCSQVRLTRQMAWSDSISRLFAADCAEHVLHFYEDKYPDDNRPRKAIEAARRRDKKAAAHAAHAAAAAYAAADAAASAAAAADDAKRGGKIDFTAIAKRAMERTTPL